MPLTIKATPPTYSSVQGDLIYTVLDSDKIADPDTYANFKYIADVYIGAVLVARIKRVADPVTGIGIFNVGQIVRNYLASFFNPTAGILVAQQSGDGIWTVSPTLHFGEEWDYTPAYDVVVDISRLFFNNYNGRLAGTLSSLIGKNDKVISNRPSTGHVLLGSNYLFVPYFAEATGAVTVAITPIGGGSGFSTTFTPSSANMMELLNVSPVALNAMHSGAITAATTSYVVQVGSQSYTFQVICEPIYQPFMLHFLNQYGGFDSKLFAKVSRNTIDITRKNYGRLPYAVDSDGQVSYKNANGVYNESQSTYSSQWMEKMVLNTDILTDAEYIWLEELLLSPMVYVEDNGYFYPITITDTTYEARKVINDDLTNLSINIEFGNQLNAQYR